MATEQAAQPTLQDVVNQVTSEQFSGELAKEKARAAEIAQLVVDFSQNEKGETLANVHTSQGFQEVYDYRGNEKKRFRLERKKEWVAAQFDAKAQLFQKVYYAKDLLLDDERELRAAFVSAKAGYDQMLQVGTGALALAYLPLTYRLAARVRPVTLLPWTAAYYLCAYKYGLQSLAVTRL